MIKLENIQKVFRTEEVETVALGGVSLEVKKGEFVAAGVLKSGLRLASVR